MRTNTRQPREAVVAAFQWQQQQSTKSQNFPPPGWVYCPVKNGADRQSCSESAEGEAPDFLAIAPKSNPVNNLMAVGGSAAIGTAPDLPFPQQMCYGFTEREPQMFVHRSALGTVGLSALAVLFVIEFGWWITRS